MASEIAVWSTDVSITYFRSICAGDNKQGYGVFIWPDNRKYEGTWHEGDDADDDDENAERDEDEEDQGELSGSRPTATSTVHLADCTTTITTWTRLKQA